MWKLGIGLLLCGVMLIGIGQSGDVYSQVRKIVGTAVDNTPPPPPIGCTPSSTFNIVAGTSVSTFNQNVLAHQFNIATNYQNYIGAAFQVGVFGAANDFIGSTIFSPTRFTSTVQFSTGANPVSTASLGTVTDTANSRVLIHAQRIVAPCNVTNCLELFLYETNDTGPVLISNITFSSIASGQGTLAGITDDNYYYFFQRNVTSSGTNIFKFSKDPSLTFIGSAAVATPPLEDIADDGTNLWAVQTVTNSMLRINKETLVTTSFPITGATATSSIFGYDPVNNHFYVASVGGTTSIVQINATTMAATGLTNSIGTEGLNFKGILVDVIAGKLYVASDVTGTTSRVRRYSLGTFVGEQTTSAVIGQQTTFAAQDFIHKRLWTSSPGSPSFVTPFTLCS